MLAGVLNCIKIAAVSMQACTVYRYVVKMTMNVSFHYELLVDVNNLFHYPSCLTCCVIHVYKAYEHSIQYRQFGIANRLFSFHPYPFVTNDQQTV